jgi:hypothetical protein
MTAPSYLSTFLWTQQLRGSAAFATKFPGAWLVWEPGAWHAPSPSARTTLSIDPGARAPKQGDSLCFLLGAPTEGRVLRVGREPDNEVLISDGTVSRHHLVLTAQDGQWRVRAVEQRVATLAGTAIPERDVPLSAGQLLVLGGVKLSFHDTSSLLLRLAQ